MRRTVIFYAFDWPQRGIDLERDIFWCCSESLSPQEFFLLLPSSNR